MQYAYVHTMGTNQTRRRILDAVVALHREVGPAATTITAIAERAGVQRLTVYRHFPDERALLEACSAHWQAAHPAPDPAAWAGIPDPHRRLLTALLELYAYFDRGSDMIARVLRDQDELPTLREIMAPWHGWVAEIAGGLSAGWGVDEPRQALVRAAVGHTLRFWTWLSLREEGLSNQEAARLMAGFVGGLADGRIAADERRR